MTLAQGALNVGTDLRIVHTDGGCSTKDRTGGWAWVCMQEGLCDSGKVLDTTNQRMEITAAYQAVLSNEGPLRIVSDSMYVVNCFRNGWWVNWHANNWRTASKTRVVSRDLWEPFIELVIARADVTFEWVKGHSGDPGNEEADRLAGVARLGAT